VGPDNEPRPKRLSPSQSTNTEQPPDTKHPSTAQPLNPVDENVVAPPTPDQRETTDDLLEALRPNVELFEEPQRVSAPESQLRPVNPATADLHGSDAVRQAPPLRREVASAQFCEIRLWRGWIKYRLYAEVEGSPGAFAESPLFRLRNPMAPPEDCVHRVLSDLLADLERSGWSVVDTGPVWYRRRLRRPAPTP
jgi:hypothetical protein